MKIYVELEVQLQTVLSSSLDDETSGKRKYDEFFVKELDINLWKIEIDLENVGDIINRFNAPQNKGILEKIKNIFKFFKK